MLMRSFIHSLFNLRLQEEQQAVKSTDIVAKLNYDITEFSERLKLVSYRGSLKLCQTTNLGWLESTVKSLWGQSDFTGNDF